MTQHSRVTDREVVGAWHTSEVDPDFRTTGPHLRLHEETFSAAQLPG